MGINSRHNIFKISFLTTHDLREEKQIDIKKSSVIRLSNSATLNSQLWILCLPVWLQVYCYRDSYLGARATYGNLLKIVTLIEGVVFPMTLI